MKYNELYNLFIKDRETYCSPKTINTYHAQLGRFTSFLQLENIIYMEQINTETLKDYLLYLRDSGIKATSIKAYFRHLYALFSFAIDNEYISPFKYKIKLPRPDPEQVLPLSQTEVSRLLRNASPRNALIIRLMVDMGLRSSEVRHLRRKDISDSFLTIVNSKCNKSRILPIPPAVKDSMHIYGLYKYDPDDFIIGISENAMKCIFSRLKQSCGISRLHAHLLRHTFATSYIMQRSNLEYLRCYMGHETYAVTQGYIQLASQCNLIHYDIYKIDPIFT